MAKNEYGEQLDKNGYARSLYPEDRCHYADDYLTACGGSGLVRHEIYHSDMGGKLRDHSKAYGAWVTLCPVHHGLVHHYPQLYEPLKRETQRRVMGRYNWTIDDFRARFDKNYL